MSQLKGFHSDVEDWSRFLLDHQKQLLEMLNKKGILKNLTKFTGKHQCQSLFLNKVTGLVRNFIKKRDGVTGIFLWILRNV